MNRAFAGAFYFLAFLNETDQHHANVLAIASGPELEIVTTAWVLTEVADAFGASRIRSRIPFFIRSLESDPDTRVVPATEGLFHQGLELYAVRQDKSWSLTDCISFVVMRDEGITDALTGDRHFAQAGFTALLADHASSP